MLYSEQLKNKHDLHFSELDNPISVLQSMLKSQATSLPGHIQAVYVHNIIKLIAFILSKSTEVDVDVPQQVET